MVMMMTRQSTRTHWDPALGVDGKAIREAGVGTGLARVLDATLQPTPLGPHFFGQLVLSIRLNEHELLIDFREFTQAPDDVTHLAMGIGAFRHMSSESSAAWSEAMASFLNVPMPHTAAGASRVVPLRARYYGVVKQDHLLWEVFTLAIGAGVGGTLGMRISRDRNRVQWFVPGEDTSLHTVLMWELHHALHGVRCQSHVSPDEDAPLLEIVSPWWQETVDCDVHVDEHNQAWFLGEHPDGGTGLWRATMGESPECVNQWDEVYCAGAFSTQSALALCVLWDEASYTSRWVIIDRQTAHPYIQCRVLPSPQPIEPDVATVALSPDGGAIAVLALDDNDCVQLTIWSVGDGSMVERLDDLPIVDAILGWCAHGIHLSGEDDDGVVRPVYWQPGTAFPTEVSQAELKTVSPDGAATLVYRDYGFDGEFDGAFEEADVDAHVMGKSSWRLDFSSESAFYDLSMASSYTFDAPRWIAYSRAQDVFQYVFHYANPPVAIDARTGRTQRLLRDVPEGSYSFCFGPNGQGVLVGSDACCWVRLISD